ncbi:SDR family oxidoreductase [Crossiella cryophila]|uniref:3-oxoacyl-[acyl-carrier protein] reductase n=1 Tax=Crossiella cryophila TaxID=43355 RepID=A0A7W7CAB6_9PSEU|nr:SDR family oxidoreductase [Crossiella cryophila]MBB4676231.1 3-oxoacyl-[acyl-carrier protein] reductase [Crossiella cryophila]
MGKQLVGKVALVTGGSRGIGAATARALGAAGADVAISYTSRPDKAEAVVEELKEAGVRALAVRADQADSAQVKELVRTVHEHFGRLDVLVNNAGVIAVDTLDPATQDDAALDRQLAINIGGVAAGVRAAAPLLGDGGRIVTVGSVLATRQAGGGVAEYSGTKAAIAAFSKGWARDLGGRGITVNTVHPGPIETDMNPNEGEAAAQRTALTALGRYGQASEVAAAIVFLAGPDAAYITGAELHVDGGMGI